MNVALDRVLARTDVWRGRQAATQAPSVLPSGCAVLDRALPGGGWPLGAVTELCLAQDGLGELSLLMPALARVTHGTPIDPRAAPHASADRHAPRFVVFVASPYPLYAPALANAGLDLARVLCVDAKSVEHAAWAAEQSLRSGACGAVVYWAPRSDDRVLRRLQLAAESGTAWCAVLRPLAAASSPSPAALRVRIEAGPRAQVFKCRGVTSSAFLPEIPLTAHVVACAPVPPAAAGRAW